MISAYAVPPDADDAFLAARRSAASEVLYRALRADVELRFVSVGAAADPAAAHSSAYEVVHEDGTPDGSAGVTLIEPFEVPVDGDAGFLGAWQERRDLLATQRGYLGTRLHRSLDSTAGLRFVGLTRWSSPLMYFRVSRQPGAPLPFRSQPALYVVVLAG